MKWVSHVLIAGAVCAVFNPLAVPAALAGSTAPDWFEFLIKAVRGISLYTSRNPSSVSSS